jgi:lipopolysaccharide/colanic/teichoic acid biosynthesis glycosyltransferase
MKSPKGFEMGIKDTPPAHVPAPSGAAVSGATDFMKEELFRKMLAIERKRSERSNRSFLLMILDLTSLQGSSYFAKTVTAVARIIHASIRETDFKGWYTQGSVIGIIFTEITGTDIDPIYNKICPPIRTSLDPATYSRLRILNFLFQGSRCMLKRSGTDGFSAMDGRIRERRNQLAPRDQGWGNQNAVNGTDVSLLPSTAPMRQKFFFSVEAEFIDESFFRKLLLIERKRSERSGRPFLLMLLDVSALHDAPCSTKVVSDISRTLHGSTRESDIKGWYAQGSVIGIIFTETDERDAKPILDDIKGSVSGFLDPADYSKVLVSCFTFPKSQKIDEGTITDLNILLYKNNGKNWRCKRCIDFLGSIFGMILFSPVFLIIPILIKCTSRGPVFFRQTRVGQYGQTFRIIKFRTMKERMSDEIHKNFVRQFIKNSSHSAAAGRVVECKMKDDPRVTPIGKILRKTSLDEIPQFINVLSGSMSLVGPRPAIPYEVDEYKVWQRRRVLEVKPGLTGIWQVKGRSRTDFDNMVRMDIRYIKKWTPLMDLKIIAQTPLALFSAKGAR